MLEPHRGVGWFGTQAPGRFTRAPETQNPKEVDTCRWKNFQKGKHHTEKGMSLLSCMSRLLGSLRRLNPVSSR